MILTLLTEKQQMIVVCEGMLQLLGPSELVTMMSIISGRIAESKVKPEEPVPQKKPQKLVTMMGIISGRTAESKVKPEEPVPQKKPGGREISVNGRKFKSAAAASEFYKMDVNKVRKLLRGHVDPIDIFPKEAPTSIRRVIVDGNKPNAQESFFQT